MQFHITKNIAGLKTLSLNSERMQECIDYARAQNIKSFDLLEYKRSDLRPLIPLKDSCEALFLREGIDLSDLCAFKSLRQLSVPDNRGKIEVSCFPTLDTLSVEGLDHVNGLGACASLRHLTINNYSPESKDLSQIPRIPALRTLWIFATSVVSLDGVENQPAVEEFSIYRGKNLEDLSALKSLAHVKVLNIEACRKVKNFEALGNVPSLEKLTLTSCAEIPTLGFVRSLSRLKFISFVGSKILDGDITPCKGVDYVGFEDMKHYNMKMKDFPNE